MQEILQHCIDFDTRAAETYRQLAEHCTDPDVALTFQRMGAEELTHVAWWTELKGAWEAGLVPDIAGETELLAALEDLEGELGNLVVEDYSALSTDEMLNLAAHFEFFMLDPAFGQLLDLMNPGSTAEHHDAYYRHVMRLVGCIEARHTRGDMARFLARVLARSFRDRQRLVSLATHDQLTGLYNRRGFYSYVRQWSSWSARYDHPLGILLVDIDYFKTVNDRFGHPIGDIALRTVSQSLESAVRTSDVIGRYGGDEFAILAPESDADDLKLLMDRILEVVRGASFDVDGEPVSLTVSVGGALMHGGFPVTPERLLARADHSLYQAKAAGRDQAGPVLAVSVDY